MRLHAVLTASLFLTTPLSAQTSSDTAGLDTQQILKSAVQKPEMRSEETTNATAQPAEPATKGGWVLAIWVSAGALLAFGYLLRHRAW